MSRRKRNQSIPGCYHVTHRCQERRFLLKFEVDRKRYLWRLLDAARRYETSVLGYMITSNHVHLLLYAVRARDVSKMMHYLQGNSARDYNRRKGREGSFWRGRYHPVLIQDGLHLRRCMVYVDLNMVRAGICRHPSEWRSCGYHEMIGTRERYRIIDRERLLKCTGVENWEMFSRWYAATVTEKAGRYNAREGWWTESAAIGDREWLEGVVGTDAGLEIREEENDRDGMRVKEEFPIYVAHGTTRQIRRFWKEKETAL